MTGIIAIKTLKTHKAAFFLAIFVGAIVAFPQIYFRYDISQSYEGIDMMSSYEESFYLSRIQEVREGRFNLAGSLFKEGKYDPYLQPPLGEILIAFLGKMLFLNLNNTILLARFIFPFLIFLAAYAFIFLISRDRLTAISASVAIFFTNISLANRESFFSLFNILQGKMPYFSMKFLPFERPVHPQVSLFFFFAFLILFWLFYKKEEWRFGVFSAIVLGLSFYIYSHLWTFLIAFWAILLLIIFFQKRRPLFKKMISMLFLGILIGAPLFLNYYLFLSHPYSSDLSARLTGEIPRVPHLSLVGVFLLIIFLIFFPRNHKKRYYFLLALLSVNFFLYNQHLITGRNIQVAHYWRYYLLPLGTIILIVLSSLRLSSKENLNRFKGAFLFLIIVISILNGIVFQVGSYFNQKPVYLALQRYGPILEYLNRNIQEEEQKKEVILSDQILSNYIPVYTSFNVFNHAVPDYLAISKERLIETFFLHHRLGGLSEKDAPEIFSRDGGVFFMEVLDIYRKEKWKEKNEIFYSLAEGYGNFLQVPLEKVLKKYGINYIIRDNKKSPSWPLEEYQFLEKVYRSGELEIFKVL